MMSTGARRTLAALVVTAGLLAGCSGDGSSSAPTSPETDEVATSSPRTDDAAATSAPADDAAPTMPADVDDRIAAVDPLDAEPLGRAEAELQGTNGTAQARVEVLAVTGHDGGYDLVMRISGEPGANISRALSFDGEGKEIDGVTLGSGEEIVMPVVYRMDPEEWELERYRCLCSQLPDQLDPDGLILRATFGQFSEPADSVSVSVPGFEEIADVPVG